MQTKRLWKPYSILLAHPFGSNCVSVMTSHIISIDRDRVMNKIYAVWGSLKPAEVQLKYDMDDENHNQSLSEPSVRNPGRCNDQSKLKRQLKSKKESTVDCVVKYVSSGHQRKYLERLYGNFACDDMLDPVQNIQQYFINAYCKKIRRGESMSPKGPNLR